MANHNVYYSIILYLPDWIIFLDTTVKPEVKASWQSATKSQLVPCMQAAVLDWRLLSAGWEPDRK